VKKKLFIRDSNVHMVSSNCISFVLLSKNYPLLFILVSLDLMDNLFPFSVICRDPMKMAVP